MDSRRSLTVLPSGEPHSFVTPSKQINEGEDVSVFLQSLAYRDIMTFLLQLNASMFPRKDKDQPSKYHAWALDAEHVSFSKPVLGIRDLIQELVKIIDEVPPDTGPRRFGNVSFRKWYQIVEERLPQLMDRCLPSHVLEFPSSPDLPSDTVDSTVSSRTELESYLLGSFGSAQRLDYGTGHELSFLAFLGCIWKLGGFDLSHSGNEERGIVLGVIEPYLRLIRKLILTYTLEPAGSHGVWGLDDHSFVPYIFGSAQLSPPISPDEDIPTEGSVPDAPSASDVAKKPAVERERKQNMYFSAIGFIYDVKRGPFWEHSPILYDVSGVTAGWAKINKGMIKMYNAEVLSKFPVVQHFRFGSLFRWERDPHAAASAPSSHIQAHQGIAKTTDPAAGGGPSTSIPAAQQASQATKAPWAAGSAQGVIGLRQGRPTPPSRTPVALASEATGRANTRLPPPTAAPWAKPESSGTREEKNPPTEFVQTKTPWAR
ncbi:Phosphotyrosyl phosphatase activator [Eremomyces bilateralis CBS 781.70]|uniref:Serine/threonine-protein phosphatase 2A activator n=1 Tax=Eremomyces bilateralis CBS 781.70 TaxID=1392243 RepID=A0A6G1G197_9PEZI|nr:Phosphotyrosyl phosphatase activator [Eremomyces bilateralis CBS 781.70]KAF1811887.1 Phosphotyrosyl phosphatase activator [Eremomyces bilateralis CBS 781.70]